MKETVFRNVDEVVDFPYNFWHEVTLDEVHLVLNGWMRRLERVCKHDEEYVLK
jgi:hypothetical protein